MNSWWVSGIRSTPGKLVKDAIAAASRSLEKVPLEQAGKYWRTSVFFFGRKGIAATLGLFSVQKTPETHAATTD